MPYYQKEGVNARSGVGNRLKSIRNHDWDSQLNMVARLTTWKASGNIPHWLFILEKGKPVANREHVIRVEDLGQIGRSKKAKKADAKLCEVNGHHWQKTVSDKVQICSRGDCGVIRQLIKGHWRHTAKVGVMQRSKRNVQNIAEMQRMILE